MVDPLLTSTPSVDPNEQEIPDLYPSCAVSRAMAKKSESQDVGYINLADTLIG